MRALAAVAVALAFPASAWADATLVTRELPVGGQRTLATASAPERFNLVGLHWKGTGRVQFRVHGADGWSAWHDAAGEPEDRPDGGTDEARRMRGWRLGSPWWTGDSDRLQVRTRGRVGRVRANYVWSPEEISIGRTLQMAGSPRIITRRMWGANEAIRRDNPVIARTLAAAVVHHTAGAAPATPAQSAALVRGIYAYHVRGNGWDDIGYNFLVDRFGQVFEGRYGGVERNVVGAHAQGFNTGSVGIALLGSYGSRTPTAAERAALTRLISWRLDVAHVDPISNAPFVSAGNPKFRAGAPIWLRAVSGHRDTGYTSCPGGRLYAELGGIARSAAAMGLPKLYTPEVEGGLGQFVSFSARLSSSLPWTVTVTDASSGRPVAAGAGYGSEIQWTWDARLAPPGSYRYQMSAGTSVRPATGIIGAPTGSLALDGVRAEPAGFTPNGDGRTDTTKVSYRLGAPAAVTASLQTDAGSELGPLFSGNRPAGPHSFTWDGLGWPDGRYRISLVARAARRTVTATVPVTVSRTLAGFGLVPTAISPNGDGRADSVTASFRLSVPADARLVIRRGAAEVATVVDAPFGAGPQALVWPGGLRDGLYTAALTVTDATGPVTQALPLRIDRVAPTIKRVTRRPLRVSLSEPARVTFVADGVATTISRPRAGIFTVVLDRPSTRLEAYAEDAASNVGRRIRLR